MDQAFIYYKVIHEKNCFYTLVLYFTYLGTVTTWLY